MKYLLLLLTVSICSLSTFAQSGPKRQINEPNYYQDSNSPNVQMAGKYLKKYTRQFYIGTGIMAAGYLVTYISFANAINQTTNGGSNVTGGAGATVGGLMLIGGAVVQLLSHRNIGKAGEMLEQSVLTHKLQLQGSPAGVGLGLAYRF